MNSGYYDPQLWEFMQSVLMLINGGILIILFVLLFSRVLIGILCKHLAKEKGYEGYFWIGILLGILGLLYVSFLPDLKMRKYLRMCSMKMQIMDSRLDDIEDRSHI